MTRAAMAATQSADVVAEVDQLDGLRAIWSPEVAVAICNRTLEADLHQWLATLPPEKLPKGRLSLTLGDVENAVVALFDDPLTARDPHVRQLGKDVKAQAEAFTRIMDIKSFEMRFDVVTNNACRKFHQDNVSARLLCAYRGRGTQYGICDTAPEPENIMDMPTGAVGLFKGRLWPAYERSSVYHRSPRIEGTGETRLLLVIDTPSCDPDCDC